MGCPFPPPWLWVELGRCYRCWQHPGVGDKGALAGRCPPALPHSPAGSGRRLQDPAGRTRGPEGTRVSGSWPIPPTPIPAPGWGGRGVPHIRHPQGTRVGSWGSPSSVCSVPGSCGDAGMRPLFVGAATPPCILGAGTPRNIVGAPCLSFPIRLMMGGLVPGLPGDSEPLCAGGGRGYPPCSHLPSWIMGALLLRGAWAAPPDPQLLTLPMLGLPAASWGQLLP